MIKIDVCSDLHTDAWYHTTQLHDPTRPMCDENGQYIHVDWEILKNPQSEILIIAGDTSNTMVETALVAKQAALHYKQVIIVDGNHEHYLSDFTVSSNMQFLRMMLADTANIAYLDMMNEPFVLDGIMFLGGTGWYDWRAFESRGISEIDAKRAWQSYSNDSRYPQYDELGDPQKIALQSAVSFSEVVRSATDNDDIKEIVMITHMSPSPDLMEWKPNNPGWNALTPSYVNTALSMVLDADSKGKIKNWIYGHTHTRQIKQLGTVTYVNNARGYPRENPPFKLTQIEVAAK